MRRREFITLIGSASVAWPLAARAQQAASPRRIGVLLVGLSPDSKEVRQFRLGLRDAGYSEGRDVVIEWRLANGDYDRVPELVADLVRSKIDVMVMDSTIGTEVAKRATSTIPIVMALVIDPVGSGLVDSLAHPGGNVTGLSMMAMELYPRRLQLELSRVRRKQRKCAAEGGSGRPNRWRRRPLHAGRHPVYRCGGWHGQPANPNGERPGMGRDLEPTRSIESVIFGKRV